MERRSVSERVPNVGQLLKQRGLEGLQTLGTLGKYNGDKRDREQHIGLN